MLYRSTTHSLRMAKRIHKK